MFTGKGNQYRFIIYKGSHRAVPTCGQSAQRASRAASSALSCPCPPSALPQSCTWAVGLGFVPTHSWALRHVLSSHPAPALCWFQFGACSPGALPQFLPVHPRSGVVMFFPSWLFSIYQQTQSPLFLFHLLTNASLL